MCGGPSPLRQRKHTMFRPTLQGKTKTIVRQKPPLFDKITENFKEIYQKVSNCSEWFSKFFRLETVLQQVDVNPTIV
jgi:hypothetical protein